jgi:cytochrome c553
MEQLSAPIALSLIVLTVAAHAQSIEQKAELCAACHGAGGVPTQKDIPVISGQQLGYLFVELHDFKSGARKNDSMTPIAQGLDQSDLLPLATYFSKQNWPDLRQQPAAGNVAAQAQRVNTSVVCTSCHQQGFRGDGTQPRLAGQSRDYLSKTMVDFRTGARANNPTMTTFMKGVSDADIAALASYLAGL